MALCSTLRSCVVPVFLLMFCIKPCFVSLLLLPNITDKKGNFLLCIKNRALDMYIIVLFNWLLCSDT